MQKKDGVLRGNGRVTFQIRPKAKFFSLILPSKAANDWRKYWLYARKTETGDGVPIPQYTAAPSKPRRMAEENFTEAEVAIIQTMVDRIKELEDEGLTMVDLFNCWLGRRIVSLQRRAHPMYKYTGPKDPTRSLASD